ncbi:alpha/beta fold hydrolase [Nocardia sp. NPDC050712]|uniref:alpha/beta hydrolase n=1 Tax=Nocardia sp. NPDC050712 TaxID=3155518 RepID=UPI0034055815
MFFDGAGGRMHYRIWRTREKIPDAVLVFLHGIGQSTVDYHRFGRAMNRHNIEVWGLDHPGHGLSEGDPHTLAPISVLVGNAELFLAVARAARPDAPLMLAGHSLGAGVALLALHAAGSDARHVRRLVLTGTPSRDLIMRLPPPAVPTLLLHGAEDRIAPIVPIRHWSARSDITELHEFPDAGHDILHEPVYPEIHTRITTFLRHRPGRPTAPAKFGGRTSTPPPSTPLTARSS